MSTSSECQCPPYPESIPGSQRAGSVSEDIAIQKWEETHRGHANYEAAKSTRIWAQPAKEG